MERVDCGCLACIETDLEGLIDMIVQANTDNALALAPLHSDTHERVLTLLRAVKKLSAKYGFFDYWGDRG